MNLIDQRNSPKTTYIILRWIAERLPYLVLKIGTQGQEIASDGYDHVLCGKQPEEDLKRDLILKKMLLEDIVGEPIYGYLAPSFP